MKKCMWICRIIVTKSFANKFPDTCSGEKKCVFVRSSKVVKYCQGHFGYWIWSFDKIRARMKKYEKKGYEMVFVYDIKERLSVERITELADGLYKFYK